MRISSIILWLASLLWATAPARATGPAPAGDEPGTKYFPGLARPALTSPGAKQPETGKPIIWIVIDATRPDDLSAYGYGRDTTPTLSALADDGITFTRFFANAPWTRPGTTSMLTGLIPSEHRVQCDWHKLPADVGTVAEQMKKAGYTTLAVVGNGNISSAFGMDKGFDVYEDTRSNWKGLPNAHQVFELGLKHIRRHSGEDKLFVLLFVLDPHDPYDPPPPYDNRYYPEYQGEVRHKVAWEYNNDYPEDQRKKVVALYDGEIRYTDDQIGWLFGELKKLGLYDRASIFVTSDHGESFGEHGVYLHAHHHYETHIRIPLLVHAPWIAPEARGTYSSAFLQQIDLGPTFIRLAGGQVPEQMKGLDIVTALRDRSTVPVPRFVISEYNCYGIRRSAIRTRRYKLVHQRPADREVFMKHVGDPKLLPSVSFDEHVYKLYDVLADPHELKNLWSELGPTKGRKLDKVLSAEIDPDAKPSHVRELDPDLIEELRSMGYMQ